MVATAVFSMTYDFELMEHLQRLSRRRESDTDFDKLSEANEAIKNIKLEQAKKAARNTKGETRKADARPPKGPQHPLTSKGKV